MYLTPDTPDALRYVRRVMRVPAESDLLALINGALSTLNYNSSWEEAGSMSPEEAARFFSALFKDFTMSTFMIGAIVSFTGSQPPEGVIPCDGRILNRVDYPDLWDKMGVEFKTATTITLPDLRGRFIFGAGFVGERSYDVAETGGTDRVALGVSELPAHAHETSPHSHSTVPHAHGYTSAAIVPNILGVEPSVAGVVPVPAVTAFSDVTVLPDSVTVLPTGEGARHENMPPFLTLMWGIVAW